MRSVSFTACSHHQFDDGQTNCPIVTIHRFDELYIDNIIYLTGELGRFAVIRSYPVERVTLMSTYEEFMVILTVVLLIVAILNYRK